MTEQEMPGPRLDAGDTALAEAMHREVDPLPPSVFPGDLWQLARRKRRRRMVGRAGAAIAIVAAVLLVAPGLGVVAPPMIGPAAGVVRGYPMRIGHQWIVRGLPARPGPIAALVESGLAHGGGIDWLAVSAGGHQWRLTVAGFDVMVPALSADGRYVGYLKPEGVGYRIDDLVTGRHTIFPEVSDGASGPGISRPGQQIGLYGQTPAYFSPDGRRVAAGGGPVGSRTGTGDRSGVVVLDRLTGRVDLVPWPVPVTTPRFLAGWSGPESFWVLSWTQTQISDGIYEVVSATVRDVGLDGRVRGSFTIHPTRPREGSFTPITFSQWTGPVSPAGTSLPAGINTSVYRFDRDGEQMMWGVPGGLTPICGFAWAGTDLIAPEQIAGPGVAVAAAVRLRDGSDPRILSVVSPRIGSGGCVIWAVDALAAGPTGPHPFGISTATWTWYWQEILAAVLLLVVGVVALIAAARRARRPA